jgi:hypothetical protein
MVARTFLWPVCFWDLTLKAERLINVSLVALSVWRSFKIRTFSVQIVGHMSARE